MQPFFCHDLANDMYSQTAKIVFSHLKIHVVKEAKDALMYFVQDFQSNLQFIDS